MTCIEWPAQANQIDDYPRGLIIPFDPSQLGKPLNLVCQFAGGAKLCPNDSQVSLMMSRQPLGVPQQIKLAKEGLDTKVQTSLLSDSFLI